MSFIPKLFKDLDYDDAIFYINPFIGVNERNTPLDILTLPTIGGIDQLVQGVKIKGVKGLEDEPEFKTWVEIEYFRPEHIIHATDINKIPTVKIRVDGLQNFCLTMVKVEGYQSSFPVPYCTSREMLVAYIKSSR